MPRRFALLINKISATDFQMGTVGAGVGFTKKGTLAMSKGTKVIEFAPKQNIIALSSRRGTDLRFFRSASLRQAGWIEAARFPEKPSTRRLASKFPTQRNREVF
jgi:hypothetical protein